MAGGKSNGFDKSDDISTLGGVLSGRGVGVGVGVTIIYLVVVVLVVFVTVTVVPALVSPC